MPIHPENEFDFPGLNIKRGTSLSGDLSGKLPGPITVSSIAGASSIIVSGSLTAGSLHGPLVGTTTNDNAAAGAVGEIIESTILVASAVALTTATAFDITSISLTAGDWDVWGSVDFVSGATTSCNGIQGWISTASATMPTRPNNGAFVNLSPVFGTGTHPAVSVGTSRLSLAVTTTVYLSTQASFSISTFGAYGYIGARRRR